MRAKRLFDDRADWESLWDTVYSFIAPERDTFFTTRRSANEVGDEVFDATAVDAAERGGFKLLARQMMDAVGKRFAVHEIIWREVEGSGMKRNFVEAKFRFVPLAFFENRTGRLRFLENESAQDGRELGIRFGQPAQRPAETARLIGGTLRASRPTKNLSQGERSPASSQLETQQDDHANHQEGKRRSCQERHPHLFHRSKFIFMPHDQNPDHAKHHHK